MATKFRNLVPVAKCKKHGVNPLILRGQEAKDWIAKNGDPGLAFYAPIVAVFIACPICKTGIGYLEGIPNAMRAALDYWNNTQL